MDIQKAYFMLSFRNQPNSFNRLKITLFFPAILYEYSSSKSIHVSFKTWHPFLAKIIHLISFISVADPGCLSRILDPDFYPSRIPDLGSRIQKQQQKRGMKKLDVIPFFVATNFTKLKIILFLKCWRKKLRSIFKEESEIRDPEKTSCGSRIVIHGQKGTGSWIPDPGSGSATLSFMWVRKRWFLYLSWRLGVWRLGRPRSISSSLIRPTVQPFTDSYQLKVSQHNRSGLKGTVAWDGFLS